MKMIFRISFVALFFFSLLSDESFAESTGAEWSPDKNPFWKSKPSALKKVTDERAILVVVTGNIKIPQSSSQKRLKMQGGGLIHRPLESTFTAIQQYEKLKQVSDHIIEVKPRVEKSEVYIHTAAYDYHARMTMSVTPKSCEAHHCELRFKVIEGHFKGMLGAFTLDEWKPGRTLLGFESQYDYTVLPMPNFFIEFGLEFMLQKVAGDMRTFLEKGEPL
jgi:hypothetical protein